jgi:hypothetical protein
MAKEGAGGGPDWNGLLKWSLAHGGDGTTPSRVLRSVQIPPSNPPGSPIQILRKARAAAVSVNWDSDFTARVTSGF